MQTSRHRLELATIKLLSAFNKIPPKLLSNMGSFMQSFEPLLPEINAYFEEQTPNSAEMFSLIDTTTRLMLSISLRSIGDYARYHNMTSQSPWSTFMGCFAIMASLIVIMEDRWDTYKASMDRPWQYRQSAHMLDYIASNEMCSTDKPVKSYTVKDMVIALRLLSYHWYHLQPRDQLRTYLYGLLHRACMLAAHPGQDSVHDLPDYRCEAGLIDGIKQEEKVYKLNVRGIRLFSMQLLRMIFVVELTWSRFPTEPGVPLLEEIEKLRTFFTARVDTLAKTREGKAELTTLFPRLMNSYGDVETFVHMRGMEKARPQSLMMTVKAETQQAFSHLHQFLMLERIIALTKDEEPDYFDKWTRAEHSYVILLKTYMMNIPLLAHKIDFYNNYVVLEFDIAFHLNKITKNTKEPLIIQLFGRLHVFHQNRILLCTCIEHALVLWIHLVKTVHGGIVDRVNVGKTLAEFYSCVAAVGAPGGPSSSLPKLMGKLVVD